MDREHISAALNLAPTTRYTLTGMTWIMWGRDLHFDVQATPPDDQPALTVALHFTDCREMRWQIYTHHNPNTREAFPPSALVNFKLGRDQHRSPAHLLTDHAGLSLLYGACWLVTATERIKLPLSQQSR